MKQYSGWQYLLIDACNQFGGDKWLFEERIQWATENLDSLEALASQAENIPLYMKAVMAIRKAQAGLPTGHVVGLDACASGIQVMSALTGCVAGATATGLVDPSRRADAYGEVTDAMATLLGGNVAVSRGDAKDALMTAMYGSKARPKAIFGEDTPELAAFYQAAMQVAPGAWELLQDLLASWQPYALVHSWKLPDGFDARIKVMEKCSARIEVDELDHATFTHEFYDNVGTPTGRSLVANVTHSVDSYILRTLQRRCNYDREVIEHAAGLIEMELLERNMYGDIKPKDVPSPKLEYYLEQYQRSNMPDVVIVPYLNAHNINLLSTQHLQFLATIVNHMLTYEPFEIICIHDDFKVHPNNANHLRQQYINIFAELAESNLLNDLLSQIHGVQGTFTKLSSNLGELIRGSEYALS